ncbi:MAG: 2-C-methyl-D-erythritol 4-phosphate cytidylyltransferase [Gemmatimonadota bacterium]
MRAAAIVVAAGKGCRFGSGTPKQFRELRGRSIVARACGALRACPEVGEIVLVLPEENVTRPPADLTGLADAIVAGGRTRQESVARGLERVGPEIDAVLVHDGARPFPGRALVARVAAAAMAGPVVPALPVTDSLKAVEGDRVLGTVEREGCMRVQTPQGFPADVLRSLHAGATVSDVRDDAELCEGTGIEVRVVNGDPWNLKITTPGDLDLAAWLLDTGRVREVP